MDDIALDEIFALAFWKWVLATNLCRSNFKLTGRNWKGLAGRPKQAVATDRGRKLQSIHNGLFFKNYIYLTLTTDCRVFLNKYKIRFRYHFTVLMLEQDFHIFSSMLWKINLFYILYFLLFFPYFLGFVIFTLCT